jgi:hypothetical protein
MAGFPGQQQMYAAGMGTPNQQYGNMNQNNYGQQQMQPQMMGYGQQGGWNPMQQNMMGTAHMMSGGNMAHAPQQILGMGSVHGNSAPNTMPNQMNMHMQQQYMMGMHNPMVSNGTTVYNQAPAYAPQMMQSSQPPPFVPHQQQQVCDAHW